MAIQTRLVGTLGGSRVEITRGLSASALYGNTTTITTIRVPAGETWLAAISGTMTTTAAIGNDPRLAIGGTGNRFPAGPASVAAEVTGTTTVTLAVGKDSSFTGTLYTIRL